jgi:hypothetical protein
MFACYMRGRGRAPRRVPPVVRLRAGAYWCRNREGSGLAASTDSGLEAFSRNPADDSVAPVRVQARANTNDPKQRFLSY